MRKIYISKKKAVITDILLFFLSLIGAIFLYVFNLELLFYIISIIVLTVIFFMFFHKDWKKYFILL